MMRFKIDCSNSRMIRNVISGMSGAPSRHHVLSRRTPGIRYVGTTQESSIRDTVSSNATTPSTTGAGPTKITAVSPSPNATTTSTTTPSPIPTTSRHRHLSSLPSYPYEEDDDDYIHDQNIILPTLQPPKSIPTAITSSTSRASGDNDDEVVTPRIGCSPSHLCYTEDTPIPITSTCQIVTPSERMHMMQDVWPVFRVMDEDGSFRDPKYDGYHPPSQDSNTTPIIMEATLNDATDTKHDNSTASTASSCNKHNLSKLKNQLLSQRPHHKSTIESSHLFTTQTKSNSYYTNPQAIEHQSFPPSLHPNTLLRAHRTILRLRTMDTILLESQRQGRISFYLTCRGEESIHVGSASALTLDDVVLVQYREAGILMWRGWSLEQFANQCFGNELDLGRGRQMPIHYGSKALNYHTISSPLGTQIPQAVGVAYSKKLAALNNPSAPKSIAIAYFGDGAASTPDFHSACNFATTLQTPMIFFCRNNGYAISTPTREQYAGDGIISRAPGYGMAAIRVDGNDLLAVHAATLAARNYAIEHSAPVMIEAMTYRQGHHSTSDDSYQYRPSQEVLEMEETADPVKRLNSFLTRYGWFDDEGKDIAQIEKEERKALLQSMKLAEKQPMPKLDTMFEDVYHDMPPHLKDQERSLMEHLDKYSDKYA